jgi:hypothetical protein
LNGREQFVARIARLAGAAAPAMTRSRFSNMLALRTNRPRAGESYP